MRFISRSALFALVVVFVMSVVGAASASAAECPGTVENGGIALCSEGHELKGTFAFSGQQKAGFEVEAPLREAAWPTLIFCKSVNLSNGSFVATTGKLEISGLDLENNGCRNIGSNKTKCELAGSTILVDGGEGKGTGPGLSAALASTAEVILVGGGTGKNWTKYRITNNGAETCTVSWTAKIHGTATCKLPESTVEAVTHVVKCEHSGNKGLFDGAGSAAFEMTAEIKLASGKPWSLQKI